MPSFHLTKTSPVFDTPDLTHFAFLTNNSYFASSPQDVIKARRLLPEVSVKISQLECDSSLEPLHHTREERESLETIQRALLRHGSLLPSLPVEILQEIFMAAVDWSPYTDAWFTNSTWWKGHRFVGAEYSPEHERYEFELMQEHERQRHKMTSGYVPHGSRLGDMSQAPWTVSHVCRRWRNIALNTPHLWAYVEVDLDWDIWSEKDNWNSLATLLDLTLDRSIPHGFNLVITGIDTKSVIKPFIYPLLLRYSQRWQRIFLLENTHFVNEKEAMPPEFPLLRNVAMYTDIFPVETRLPNLETWYSLLPSPRFGESFSRYNTLVSGFSCQMKARSKNPEIFIHGLEQIATMRRLRTLRITLVEYAYTGSKWPDARRPIRLTTVQDLSLSTGSAADSSSHTLSLLSIPSLKVLHLLSLDVPLPLISFIKCSGCSLSSLHIDDVSLDGSELLEVLRYTPCLESLHLTFIAVSRAPHWRETTWVGFIKDEVLEWIFDPNKGLLPLLRRISLLNLKEMNLDVLFEILRRRLGNNDNSTSSLEYVQTTLPSFETTSEHEENVRYFRCQYRCIIEVGPWNFYYHDSSSEEESEAQFTFEPSESEWSTDDKSSIQESDHPLDWEIDWPDDSSSADGDYDPWS